MNEMNTYRGDIKWHIHVNIVTELVQIAFANRNKKKKKNPYPSDGEGNKMNIYELLSHVPLDPFGGHFTPLYVCVGCGWKEYTILILYFSNVSLCKCDWMHNIFFFRSRIAISITLPDIEVSVAGFTNVSPKRVHQKMNTI